VGSMETNSQGLRKVKTMDVTQYVEDNRFYFWSTINREETQFEVDMGQDPVGGKLECVVMTGVHKGETRMYPWLNLNALWEQQQQEQEHEEE
jgi:hypothetical protein